MIPPEEVSGPRMLADLAELARWVKLSGTKEEAESLGFVRRRLEEAGYRCTLLRHPAYIGLPGKAGVEVGSMGFDAITHSLSLPSPEGRGLDAPLVDIGEGTEADFAGRDLAGTILLVDGIATPAVAARAARAGAVGQLHVSPNEHLYEMCVSPVWGSPSAETWDALPRTVVCTVSAADGAMARQALAAQPGLRAVLWARVDLGWRETPLLVAELDAPGAGPDDPFLLFSGHHDTWHHGVMDNGAANATMLEVARIAASHRAAWKRGLRLCFWSGHSHGRYSGSAWYADAHWEELAARCVAHVNVDSTGGIGASVLTNTGASYELWGLAADAIRAQGGQDYSGKRSGRSGDQSFWGIGIPAMFGTLSNQPPSALKMRNALGWWWHTPQDTIDKVDEANLVRDTRIFVHAVGRLLTDPALPLDYARHARALGAELSGLAARLGARLPLGALVARAEALAQAAAGPHPDAVLMRVARALVPMDYTAGDRFVHDSALPHPAWPVLQPIRDYAATAEGDAAQPLRVGAVRARNRVAHALSEALAAFGADSRRGPG
jgi:hypothetical protein